MRLFNLLLVVAITWPLLLGDHVGETVKQCLAALSLIALFAVGFIIDKRHSPTNK